MNWQESFKVGLPIYIGIIKQFIASEIHNSKTVSVREVLQKNLKEEKLIKLKTKEYQKEGLYPIVDQGKRFICGYTDNKSILFSENLPIIIFGDHTRNLKFIDFPFAVGADGTKILKPIKKISDKFFYYSLFDFKHSERGYSRYFKQLANHFLTIPFIDEEAKSLDYQISIVTFLDNLEENSLDKNKTYFGKQIEEKIISLQNFIEDRKTLSTELNRQLALVKELRQAYLREAMQGKLVPQDFRDEPAEILLEKIKAEKYNRLLACSGGEASDRRKRDRLTARRTKIKPVSEIKPEEIPFEIPNNWTWCRLGELAEMCLGKMLDQVKNKGELQPYLRNVNVRWGSFDLSDLKEMRFTQDEEERFSAIYGDLIICEGGEPGRAAIWKDEQPIKIQKAVHRVRTDKQALQSEYLYYCLLTDATSKRLNEYFTGGGIQHFTGKSLSKYAIPLPPLAEQKRIVEKLEKLMKYCDELEANIRESKERAESLLQVALKEALKS